MVNTIFEKGIKFKCQGSANCCISRGNHGYVFLSQKDLLRLSIYFKVTKKYFKKKFCQTTDDYLHLKEIKKNGECIFLNKKKCSVYSARPTQCRTWPFWPENMNSKIWNKEILNFCPGIGKGKLFNKKKITKLLKTDKINSSQTYIDKSNYLKK